MLANSKHFVKTMIFGENQQLSMNHSSIATEVFSSDSAIAHVGLFNGTEEFDLKTYDKREVQFFDQTGPVQVTTVSKSFYSNMRGQNLQEE